MIPQLTYFKHIYITITILSSPASVVYMICICNRILIFIIIIILLLLIIIIILLLLIFYSTTLSIIIILSSPLKGPKSNNNDDDDDDSSPEKARFFHEGDTLVAQQGTLNHLSPFFCSKHILYSLYIYILYTY